MRAKRLKMITISMRKLRALIVRMDTLQNNEVEERDTDWLRQVESDTFCVVLQGINSNSGIKII
jgi:hypothetical protein